MRPMLEITSLSAGYGQLRAIRNVDLVVKQGEIVSLVGANGAGKSTLMKVISGLLKPAGGRIRFDGQDLAGARPAEIVRRGIAHVPEGRRVFSNLTVQE